jgi:hypothetical protein
VRLAVSIRSGKQSFEKLFVSSNPAFSYTHSYQEKSHMSEPGSISAIVEASSGTAAPNAAGAATPRLAIHFADTANFIKALADSLLEQGVPQDAPPFSVRSFTTDASNIPLYGVDGDGYTKTLHEISAIADRGQEMLAFLGKHRNFGRFAMPQSPGPSRANLNTGGATLDAARGLHRPRLRPSRPPDLRRPGRIGAQEPSLRHDLSQRAAQRCVPYGG